MTQYIHKTCDLSSIKGIPIILYEDNVINITQLKERYIKRGWTKQIWPKKIFTHELNKYGDIDVQQIR